MSEKTMKENLQSFAAKQILHYLDEDPEKSLPKLLEWADKFDKDNTLPSQRRVFHNILENPDNNWYKLIMSLWSDIDPAVRMTFFENFIVNASLIGYGRQEKAAAEHNCNIPWAILMDPTSACNLHCTGCWAAEYGNKLNMSFETMDNIIRQGKELGTYMYIFSGGEPHGAQGRHHPPVRDPPGLHVPGLYQRHPHRREVRRRDAAGEELCSRHQRGGL